MLKFLFSSAEVLLDLFLILEVTETVVGTSSTSYTRDASSNSYLERHNVLPSERSFEQNMPHGLTHKESNSKEDGNRPIYYPGREILDNKGRYLLEWTVDLDRKTITFNITVKTEGWVGLGLSRDGTMKNADIMIGGVQGNHVPYIRDYYSDFNRHIHADSKQDWNLLYVQQVNGVTHILVSRMWDTCDPQDIPITEDLSRVIWAYGETDVPEYHFDKRGSFRVYLLDPIVKTKEKNLMRWRVARRTTILPKETTYWCSIHKAPKLMKKHHIVEVHPYLPNNLSLSHTHHMGIRKCVAPPGMNARDIFEPLVNYEGEECYFIDNHRIPIQLCLHIMKGYGLGGKAFIFPESVGLPLSEQPDEYWMLQSHYDNPELLPMTLESGFDLHFTDKLRPNDAQALFVHYDFWGLFLIPPVTTNLEVTGICSPDCTNDIIPPTGVQIVYAFLHTHNFGKRVKLQHFRNGTELPWIMKDDNYDPTFQQTRILREPRLVLPGDQLIMRCEYDNTWTNKSGLSGYATKDEMCFADIGINKIIPYGTCNSRIPDANLLPLIGVQDYEWDMWTQERIVSLPRTLAGKSVSAVSDSKDWTQALRKKLQDVTNLSVQTGTCSKILVSGQTPSKLQGNVISHDANLRNIVNLAKGHGHGSTTLMGEFRGVPKFTPGPTSIAMYPHRVPSYKPEIFCRSQV